MMKNKMSIYMPVLLALALITGIFLGNRLNTGNNQRITGFSSAKSNKLGAIVDLIANAYVDSVSKEQLVEGAIPGLLKKLDPHTTYIPAKEMQEVTEEMTGNFSGIGVQFSLQNDTVMVVDVVSGGPSHKLGLLPGDRIVTVNDSTIAGVQVTNEKVMGLLRGEKGTHVRVGIKRRGIDELIDYDIVRGDIPIFSVDVSYMIDNTTGYIKVSRFAERTYEEFMKGLEKLNEEGMQKIIVDLRGNPGGYLGAVIRMVNEFLEGSEPILYTEGNSQPRKTYNASEKGKLTDKDIVVLIDDFSASASEIFAGAIQDNDRGWVVGRRSFGKGLVQEQIPLMDGSALRLTVSRYYTPSGRCIQKPYENGTDEYYQDIMNRMVHGEFQEADSIHMPDSLSYKTLHGRTVYGGGGIMPDYFVPADTTGYSDYFSKLVQKRLIYTYALDYADQHRNELKKFSKAAELDKYLSAKNILADFVVYASRNGVPKDTEGLGISGKIIDVQLRAYIARNILGEEGFYPIIMQIDNALLKALEVAKQPAPKFMKLPVTNR
ncbi:MAG: S41 family peptidase [Prolixibacteraceae bacterium]|nr:S41 family peptidase [Prolixibacteraceae bacterium]